MNTNPDDSFALRIKEIKDRYIAGLESKKATIEEIITRLHSSSDISNEMNLLFREIHTLSGSAGTFGLNEISKKAQAFEIELANHIENKKSPVEILPKIIPTWHELSQAIDSEL